MERDKFQNGLKMYERILKTTSHVRKFLAALFNSFYPNIRNLLSFLIYLYILLLPSLSDCDIFFVKTSSTLINKFNKTTAGFSS